MNDCPNADVRDLLPDLINDRLDEATRRMVEAHLAHCADCRDELAVLRDVRATMRHTPAVDVAGIVAALPAYRAPARRSWVGWRIAAAITVVAAGASSLVVVRGGARAPTVDSVAMTITKGSESPVAVSTPARSESSAVVPSVTPAAPHSPAPAPAAGGQATTAAPRERELAMAGGALTDLSDRELATLLKDIESMDALPSVDVESTTATPLSPRRAP